MPLELGDIRNLDEEPLSSCVLEARFLDAELHSPTGMNEHSFKSSLTASTDLAVHSFAKVEDSRPDSEAPALVAKAMFRLVEGETGGKGGVW